MNYDFDVFYTQEEFCLPVFIDAVKVREDGVLVGFYWNETKEQMEEEYKKEMKIGKWSEISKMIEDGFCTEPQPISEEDWEKALCVLPPEDFEAVDDVESFKCMEYFWGQITSIYAKTSKGCYVFKNRASMTAKEIAEKINSLVCDVVVAD